MLCERVIENEHKHFFYEKENNMKWKYDQLLGEGRVRKYLSFF